jgi:hypothetical protein
VRPPHAQSAVGHSLVRGLATRDSNRGVSLESVSAWWLEGWQSVSHDELTLHGARVTWRCAHERTYVASGIKYWFLAFLSSTDAQPAAAALPRSSLGDGPHAPSKHNIHVINTLNNTQSARMHARRGAGLGRRAPGIADEEDLVDAEAPLLADVQNGIGRRLAGPELTVQH